MMRAQESLAFDDVAVQFTWEEWQLLSPAYKNLFLDVMLENYNNLVSLGYQGSKPVALSRLERGEQPWMIGEEIHRGAHAEIWKVDDHQLSNLQNESMVYGMEQCHDCNAFENIVHQSSTHFSLRKNHAMSHLHGKSLKSHLNLANQSRSYETENSVSFNRDEKSFLHANNEQFHNEIKFHENRKPIGTKFQFIKQQKTHKIEKSHVCNECGKAFTRKSWLTDHQVIHTGAKPHRCDRCGKAFSRKFMLTEHQKIHTGEKPYICCECGKGFIQKGNLIVHERIHTGEKPYICNECGKGFIQKTCLIAHQRFHTGKTPFVCSECGKSCSQKSGLIKHQQIHTGEKPYKCGECGKAFPTKEKLVVHQRIHTGERPYGCKECGKAFAYMSCLVKHKRIHTREKCVDSVKVDDPSTKKHNSLPTSDLRQEKNSANTVSVQLPLVSPQTSLNMSGLLTNRNVVLMGQPFARCNPQDITQSLPRKETL